MKLVVEEPESAALEGHVRPDVALATSRIALVEVPRATRIANPSEDVQHGSRRLTAACLLVEVGDRLLGDAAALASRPGWTLDAVHLATPLYVDADELVGYDRCLLHARRPRD